MGIFYRKYVRGSNGKLPHMPPLPFLISMVVVRRLYLVKHLNSYNCYVNMLSEKSKNAMETTNGKKQIHACSYYAHGYLNTLTSKQLSVN